MLISAHARVNALKRDAGGKKGQLLCRKCIFDRIKGNLAEIQPKNHQNVQKTHLLKKVPGVNGLKSSNQFFFQTKEVTILLVINFIKVELNFQKLGPRSFSSRPLTESVMAEWSDLIAAFISTNSTSSCKSLLISH